MEHSSVKLSEFLSRVGLLADDLGNLLEQLQHEIQIAGGTAGQLTGLQNLDRATQTAHEISHVLARVSADVKTSDYDGRVKIDIGSVSFRLEDIGIFLATGEGRPTGCGNAGELELF
ncbi:hypothetical protein [Acetobacter oeni]|uniref:Uncharacterized protein n=1 Tax=Acetobacter oeni TaxID=304077 RepID=A0A511XLS7_9PROT|nr:hypothetical protein [Acetobacter oeni]MBB3882976.1 hypothetical protein [Acetobacter oeni]NHO19054.1 hypothetical protein [Acetobacter oeni]GBR09221.1 hypothetical protein AA21952_2791 [Acetobacter oeni LMG 21952]GEN63905.1 hypothetical protein AOE01nite_21290 [Acetobacter oeni]